MLSVRCCHVMPPFSPQVKVKAEVADSNAQARRLAQYLNDLERRIDACEHPNPDKEVSDFLGLEFIINALKLIIRIPVHIG